MNWLIERLYVKPNDGSLQNVVITADWRCNGSQGEYSGTCYGQTSFTPPEPDKFTPFDQLTQDQILQWVWNSGVDKSACEASVQTQIANQINPPIISPPLPWVTNTP